MDNPSNSAVVTGGAIAPTQIQAAIVGASVLVYTRTGNDNKVERREVPMSPKQCRSLLGFITHKLHGGRLRLSKLPQEKEEKRIITL